MFKSLALVAAVSSAAALDGAKDAWTEAAAVISATSKIPSATMACKATTGFKAAADGKTGTVFANNTVDLVSTGAETFVYDTTNTDNKVIS